MIEGKKVIAIITARGGSKGLPGKNIIDLNGKPLIAWTIDEAKKSKYIDKLIVSTDCEEIEKISKKFGAEVPFLRPESLASDTATSMDVVFHALNFFEEKNEIFEYIVLLEPTSPLRTVEDIDTPLEILYKDKEGKAIVGVAKTESSHPTCCVSINQQGLITPYLDQDHVTSLRRQDMSEVYFFDGTIYISDIETLKIKKSFYHEKTLPYIVSRDKQFEIDEKMDLYIIEAMIKYREDQNER